MCAASFAQKKEKKMLYGLVHPQKKGFFFFFLPILMSYLQDLLSRVENKRMLIFCPQNESQCCFGPY